MIPKYAVKALSFGTILSIAALSASATLAQGYGTPDGSMDPFSKHVRQTANKDGMVTKKSFMAMMEKRWNMRDKDKKGVLHKDEVMKLISEEPYAGH
jgi:hypothetical protein